MLNRKRQPSERFQTAPRGVFAAGATGAEVMGAATGAAAYTGVGRVSEMDWSPSLTSIAL